MIITFSNITFIEGDDDDYYCYYYYYYFIIIAITRRTNYSLISAQIFCTYTTNWEISAIWLAESRGISA